MLKKNIKNRLREVGIPLLFFLGGFSLWEILIIILDIPKFLLPKPSEIIIEIFNNFTFFLKNLGITMLEALIGYFIAILLSFVLAVIFVHSKTIKSGLYPYAIAIKIAPMLALAPFVILWFGIGFESKIIIVILICFFPLLVNFVKGLESISKEALDLLKSFSASKWKIFLKLRLPNSLPFIFPALKISSTLAITGAFVGEFLSAKQGIGYLIMIYSKLFETTSAFAALFLIILTGILFFLLIDFIEKKVVFWQDSKEM